MLADKSLLAAYAEGVSQVGAEQVSRAVGDSLPKAGRRIPGAGSLAMVPAAFWKRWLPMGAGALAVLVLGYGLGYGSGHRGEGRPQTAVATSQMASGAVEAQAVPVPVPVSESQAAPVASVSIAPPEKPVSPEAVTTAVKAPSDSALRSESLTIRMQATNQFIADPSTQGFTVQLLSQRAPRQAEVMITAQEIQQVLDQASAKAGEPSTVPVLVHDRLYQGQVFHAMYVGHFDSRLAALQFVEAAPPALKRYKPVVRSLDAIRKEPAP
jgi:septal ring-binding cell division protein DamX